jgi:sugar/nucleoside kinase (ribokinase family)
MSEILNMGICAVDGIAQTIDEYPPRGGLRLFDKLTMTTGGNAVNCSIAMGKMGVPCDIMIKIGNDSLGEFILSELKKYGVNTASVIREEGTSSPFTFCMIHSGGQRSFFHTMGTNGTFCYDDVDTRKVQSAKIVFFTGSMVMRTIDGEQTAHVLADAKKGGAVTLLDTVYTDAAGEKAWQKAIFPCLPHLDFFIPSQPEARTLTGKTEPGEIGKSLRDKGCRNAVIKLDERGAFCSLADGTEAMVPAYVVDKVVDTTGAGDCWSAGFITGLWKKLNVPEAALLGNAVAAHCIQNPGASAGIPPLAEVQAFQKRTPQRKL